MEKNLSSSISSPDLCFSQFIILFCSTVRHIWHGRYTSVLFFLLPQPSLSQFLFCRNSIRYVPFLTRESVTRKRTLWVCRPLEQDEVGCTRVPERVDDIKVVKEEGTGTDPRSRTEKCQEMNRMSAPYGRVFRGPGNKHRSDVENVKSPPFWPSRMVRTQPLVPPTGPLNTT